MFTALLNGLNAIKHRITFSRIVDPIEESIIALLTGGELTKSNIRAHFDHLQYKLVDRTVESMLRAGIIQTRNVKHPSSIAHFETYYSLK